ncbi:hypothetical protein CONCODRAFT_71685 [Conidiobolus coronatus NRRL 28638]|uniref:Uncharacterized protein n=1 Tax=Conidiobolus coronatus (strain ATCC 28846 / CBS 209.66 / NRRL 28638) TaxID=796925 RepID=A0A137P284_CONC2|nr:hypothetical protein CONCODRAFT_71685 [Conidiobolus coronatus NRRL 28638]|eukprot:KXN69157.1 hypothetical protein CONCODRAFT_71685 [Conidiobolus coronatus NRRL 28638]
MYLYAQTNPCLLMAPGYPKAMAVVNSRVVVRDSHFSTGARFVNERIGNTYFLKFKGKYISIINGSAVVVDDINRLTELVYIEPYENSVFHLKYKNDYLNIYMNLVILECPIRLQWASFDSALSNCEMERYYNSYDFLGLSQFDYISIDGLDILTCEYSFYLICDGDFNKQLDYNKGDQLLEFISFGCKSRIPLKFIDTDEGVCIYSDEFGYLQVEYNREWETYMPVFSRDSFECPLILEQAETYSSYYLKYKSMYVRVVNQEFYTCTILTQNIEKASVFQIMSDY